MIKEVKELLNSMGQLKLRTPYNIFVGGQILDRGVTIDNLIGFYYGRLPKKFQQDTVLQHSRMYGARSEADMAVTRFYTTLNIYQTMKRIHEFDSELRKVLESKTDIDQQGVYFIRKDDTNKLMPCSPNKLLLSNITTLKPFKRLLPVGFQTGYKTNIKKFVEEIDTTIENLQITNDPLLVDYAIVYDLVEKISKTIEFVEGYEWDKTAFLGSIEYLLTKNTDPKTKNKVWLLIRKDRNLTRIKKDGGFSDAPDTSQDEGVIAKKTAIDIPMLMLFRENGTVEQGWKGSPFWWPVLFIPKNVKTVIFASEISK